MFRVTLLLALACVSAHSALADTTWVAAGQISGNWTAAGSPYMISAGNDTVATGNTLAIDPGVKVFFAGPFRMIVNGLLQALGTEADSIYFTTDTLSNPNRWRGLRFQNANDSCRLEYCVIEHGRAVGAGDDRYGGGIECRTSRPTITHARIRYNYAQIDGGGIYCQINSAPLISECEIYNNTAQFGGGGGMLTRNSTPQLVNCDIHHNATPLNGGGVMFRNLSFPLLTDCDIHNNSASSGGGVYCTGSTAVLTECTISENIGAVSGGGVGIASGASQLLRCWISSNSAPYGGGVSDSALGVTLRNCAIVNNTATTYGGGLFTANSATTLISHCTFFGNGSISGGNIQFYFTAATLENSIVAFSSQGDGLTIFTDPAYVIRNNCFYGNSGNELGGNYPPEMGVEDTVNLNGDPCDHWENIYLDPQYVNPAGGDLHLADASQCISAAQSSNVNDDFEGNARPNPAGTQPDMGAFESAIGGDLYACGELAGNIGPGDVVVPCEISVAQGETLNIAPGTRFHFLGRFAFTIRGRLNAIGTAADSILFTRAGDDSTTDWRGLRFLSAHDSTQLSYVIIEHARGEGSAPLAGSGGVYGEDASFHMDHCTIRNNTSTHRGGGIALYGNSQPHFSECAIVNNTARGTLFIFGGGVYADHAAPHFNGCEIAFNTATHRGGGVYADSSNLDLTNCLVHHNSAPDGAGVYSDGASPEFLRCSFYLNTATTSGGGAFLHSHASFSACTIYNNAAANGAGIYTDFFDPYLDLSVLYSNTASANGGAVYARTSAPVITRCTMAANSAPTGSSIYFFSAAPYLSSSIVVQSVNAAVYFESSASAIVRYCDFASNPGGNFAFFNNDPAQGPASLGILDHTNVNDDPCDLYSNIQLNPQFVNAPEHDFHLQDGSPCIQAGDPQLPLDPDGTIADIGAFYVGQPVSPPAPFDLLLPVNNDTTVGDEIEFCWQAAVDPDAGDVVTYWLHFQTIDTGFTRFVGIDTCATLLRGALPFADSAFAAWWVEARALYPDTTLFSNSLWYFYWFPAPDTDAVDDDVLLHPSSFALSAYPNPFNAQATIRYALPVRSEMTLEVFDVLGRRVAMLAEGMQEAGSHQVSFDASQLSSGIYFARLSAGEFVRTDKLMLMK